MSQCVVTLRIELVTFPVLKIMQSGLQVREGCSYSHWAWQGVHECSHVLHSSKLQFNLSVGIIGVIYLGCESLHTVGIISAGQVTDRLVSFFL